MFAIGASGVESYKIEKDVALKPGGSFTIAGYEFKFVERRAMSRARTTMPSRRVVQVTPRRQAGHDAVPAETPFWVQHTDNSQAAISVNWARDLFVAMGNPLGDECLEHAHPVQAVGALHLAGRHRHGAGRHRSLRPIGAIGSRCRPPRRTIVPPPSRARARVRLMWKFILPLAVFIALVVLFAFGLESQPRHPRAALAADRQAGAAVLAQRRARCRSHGQQRDAQGPGVRAQRLGHLVRAVPRRT